MLKKSVKYTMLMSAVLCSYTSSANLFDEYMTDPEDGMLDASKYISQTPLGFLPVPSIITEPAVGTGLALMGLFFHDTKEDEKKAYTDKPLLPKSISIVGAMATENGTWGGGIGHISFWQNDTLRYKGFAGFGDFNLDFYSVGGRTTQRPIALNLKGPAVLQQLSKRLPDSNIFIGAKQLFRNVDISLDEPLFPNHEFSQNILDALDKQLNLDINTSGLGALIEYDSRNNPLNPESGYNYLAEYMLFTDAIGSDVDYQSTLLKGLNYWQLTPQVNVAFRAQYDGVTADSDSDLPVYVLPFVDLRGIAKSRYQGSDVLVGEAEVTYKFNTRWRASIFSGVGKAANSFSDIGSSSSRTTIGTGFRYLIAKRYGFVMGLDFAKGPEENAVYIQAGANW